MTSLPISSNVPPGSADCGGSRPGGLRILHLVEAFGGGVFEMVRLLSSGSAAQGHHVAVAYGVRPETPQDVDLHFDPRVELIRTPWQSRTLRANLRARRAVRALINAWKPDIVHMHSSFAGVIGASVAPRGVVTIHTPHAYSFEMRNQSMHKRALYRLLETYVSRRVTIVAGVSLEEARLARDELKAPRVTAIANGIPELDSGVVRRTQETRRPPLTVGMGRVSPQRQPASCARILAALSDVSELRWIGGGPIGAPDLAALEESGVSVTGWVAHEDALAQLGDADVYLHWTAWDGQPLSVLEAIARDVVVIANDIPPLREILGPRQVCRTEAEASHLIRDVLTTPGLKQSMLAHQRDRAPHFASRRMLSEWHDLYGELKPAEANISTPWLSAAAV